MKRIYIILLLILPLAIISGCSKKYDSVFDEPASTRVQKLMEKTLNTLNASEDGWYIEHYQGWDQSAELGGYWFWCKFEPNNQMSTVFELPVTTEYPVGAEYDSEYQISRGSGAVLIFDTYNQIMHFFVEPGDGHGMAYQGDVEFQIHEVQDNYIKMQGSRSKKFIYFYKKTDGMSVQDAMTKRAAWGKRLDNATASTAVVDGSHTTDPKYKTSFTIEAAPGSGPWPSGIKNRRIITLTYHTEFNTDEYDDQGNEIVIVTKHEVRMPFAPEVDEEGNGIGIKLYEPVYIMGNRITGFTYDSQNGAFYSNDEYFSVTLNFTLGS